MNCAGPPISPPPFRHRYKMNMGRPGSTPSSGGPRVVLPVFRSVESCSLPSVFFFADISAVMITKLFSEQVTAVPLVAALFVLYLARTVIAWARLRQFTGPRWTGVSNIPHGKAALSEKCHEWYAKVSKEHGTCGSRDDGLFSPRSCTCT